MPVDRLTKCLLIAVSASLAAIALRTPSSGSAAAQAPAQPPASTVGLSGLQVSATPNGFLAFDRATGEVLRVTVAEKASLESLGTLRKGAGGKWEFGAEKSNGAAAPAPEDGARMVTAQADVAKLMAALRAFKRDAGRFPSTEEGLQALVVQPTSVENWKGPYLKEGLPKDPWGNPYVYREPGTLNADAVDVLSFGPDLRDGGGDDLFGR